MKFRKQDIIYFDWIDGIVKATILVCYPKRNQYQIKTSNGYEKNINADDVFSNVKEVLQNELREAEDNFVYYQSEIKRLKEKLNKI